MAFATARRRGAPAITAARTTFSSVLIPSSRLKNWKTKPMCSRRIRARAFSSVPVSDRPGEPDLAAAGLVDAGDEVQQRRLPAARGPHDRDELAAVELEVDAAERTHVHRPGPVALAQPAHPEHLGHG
jgi:hypothetical protein